MSGVDGFGTFYGILFKVLFLFLLLLDLLDIFGSLSPRLYSFEFGQVDFAVGMRVDAALVVLGDLGGDVFVLVVLLVVVEVNHLAEFSLGALGGVSFQVFGLVVELIASGNLGVEDFHPLVGELIGVIVVLIWEVNVVELVQIQIGGVVKSVAAKSDLNVQQTVFRILEEKQHLS